MYALILFLLPLSTVFGQAVIHAPYQVGIYRFDNYNPSFGAKNFPICSAAIIHPLFCLTTADCVHARIVVHNIVQPYPPKSIYIKSGNFSEIRENIKYVKDIYIHPEFNSTTLNNDIALIQVEAAFQFIHPYSERWVQLPDIFTNYNKCIYSVNKPNMGQNDLYPFGEVRQTTVVNNSICHGNLSSFLPQNNTNKMCSFYQFDHSFMCQVPESQLSLNRDRGTPLICDNTLAGLMSAIIPTNITNSTDTCTKTLRTYAYYTRVARFEKWIRSMMNNSPEHMPDGKPIPIIPISPPYQNNLTASKPGKNAATNNGPNFIVMIFITWLLIHKFSAI
ncbi:chymotrypsin-like protease CTRL-1 [Contarinia nasturtii]|uniref:chymotrypsin-like protease CTRL-1 n=1 Tax=Contarinia nasturtii TaxID=265458 RepID=UPI0012D3CA8E|nr:chymotrypsin-like protease CTRL-1 [Contarinia nasturtii]